MRDQPVLARRAHPWLNGTAFPEPRFRMTHLQCRLPTPALLVLLSCAGVAPLSGQEDAPWGGQEDAPPSGQAGAPPSGRADFVHIVHGGGRHEVAPARAQSARLRFEPWGGVLFDAYRNEGGNGRPAWIGAVRFGYELGTGTASAGKGWRLIGELARAEAAEAGTAEVGDSLLVGFRTEWWLATGGVEWDVVGGWTGGTLEAQGGAAWLQREIVAGDPVPPGTPGTSERAEYTAVPALIVALSGYRHLTHRVQVRVRLADVVTDVVDAPEHSPALGLGLRFVFE